MSQTREEVTFTKGKRLPIVVPTFAEQTRIVDRVKQSMVLCEGLQAQLTTTDAANRHLLEALLHKALGTPQPQ